MTVESIKVSQVTKTLIVIIFSALFIILQFIAACSGPVCVCCVTVELGYVQVAAGIIIHYQVYRVERVHKDHPFEWASECVHSKSAQLHSRAHPRLSMRSVPLFRCLVIKVQVLRGGRLSAAPHPPFRVWPKHKGVEIITPDVLVWTWTCKQWGLVTQSCAGGHCSLFMTPDLWWQHLSRGHVDVNEASSEQEVPTVTVKYPSSNMWRTEWVMGIWLVIVVN